MFHVNCRVPGVTSGKVTAVALCLCPAVLPQLVMPQGKTSQRTVHSTAEHKSSDTPWSRFPSQHSCSSLPTANRDSLWHLRCALHSSRGSLVSSQGVKFSNKVDKHFLFSSRPNTENTGPCLSCSMQWHSTCSMSFAALFSLFSVSWLSPAQAGSLQVWTKYCTTCWNHSQLLGSWSGNYSMRGTFLSKNVSTNEQNMCCSTCLSCTACVPGSSILEANMEKKPNKTVEKHKVTASLTERWKKKPVPPVPKLDILGKYEENSKGFSMWSPPERCAVKRLALF